MRLLSTQESTALALKNNLGRRVVSISFDQNIKLHRVHVQVFAAGDKGRSESANYYVLSEDEIFSQESALNLATSNFLGQTHGYTIKPGKFAPNQEATNGNNEESSEESNEESNGKKSSPKGSKKASSKSVTSAKSKEEVVTPASSSDDMEEVASPFKEPVKTKSKNTTYSRTEERHVDILTSFLNQITGGDSWKQNPKITQFSISLVGKDFIDPEGNIVPEFAASCRKFFGIESGL